MTSTQSPGAASSAQQAGLSYAAVLTSNLEAAQPAQAQAQGATRAAKSPRLSSCLATRPGAEAQPDDAALQAPRNDKSLRLSSKLRAPGTRADCTTIPVGQLVGVNSTELKAMLSEAAHAVLESRPSTQQVGQKRPHTDTGAAVEQLSAAFIDLMAGVQDSRVLVLTENGALTNASSGSAAVDFFFNVADTTNSKAARQFLEQAWAEDPLEALRLVAQLRDIRNGKGVTAAGQECLTWLQERHPLTLAANLEEVVRVGYWKDLLEILARQAVGEEVFEAQREARIKHNERAPTRRMHKSQRGKKESSGPRRQRWQMAFDPSPRRAAKKERREAWKLHLKQLEKQPDGAAKVAAAKKEKAERHALELQQRIEEAAQLRRQKRDGQRDVARHLLETEPRYRLLHLAVATQFAQQLQKDLQLLKAGGKGISLAAKWAPSNGRSADRVTLLATTIATMLFPEEKPAAGQEAQHFVHVLRMRYQREVLAPLRQALHIPEVASVCMHRSKHLFEFHDEERFKQYLEDVKTGKDGATITAGALKPHELVHQAMELSGKHLFQQYSLMYNTDSSDDEEGTGAAPTVSEKDKTALEVVELQWKAYVDKLRESGTLSSTLSVCDVSGSMHGQPMEVAIALGLLTAEVSAPPFNQLVCTFSSNPELHHIKFGSLVEKVQDLQAMNWGMHTNFDGVFDLILEQAIQAKLPREQMIQQVVCYSDMEFNECSSGVTNFEGAKRKFEKAGYKLPKLIFWNLRPYALDRLHGREAASTPVTQHESGTALVSGFSGQLLKLFMSSTLEDFTPLTVMREATARYDSWVVVD
eukprot:jgi/Astpho2/8284/Aster-x0811